MGKASRHKQRRRTRPDPIPPWAAGHSEGSLARMLDLLAAGWNALGYHKQQLRLDEAAMFVARPDQPELELRVNLANLAAGLVGSPLESWPSQVDLFLQTAADPGLFLREVPWGELATRIRARLYSAPAHDGLGTVGRPITPDLRLSPVIDYPNSVRVILEAELANWGKSLDELLELGLAKTAECEPLPEPERLPLLPAGHIERYVGPSVYTATHLARLEQLVADHRLGALVATPRRDTLLLHRIVDARAVFAVDAMARLAAQMCSAGPYSLSYLLYWWHDGRFEAVSALRAGRLRISVPRDLRRLLGEMLPADAPARSAAAPRGH